MNKEIEKSLMTPKKKFELAFNHIEGPIPLDIGGTPTTGIHVETMERLRDYYGLEKRIPKIIEPYQMLGMVEDDLREAVGIDTKPLWSRWTMFGFENKGWKEWLTPWGQKVLVSEDFQVDETEEDIFIYAGGDRNYPPAGVMPRSGYFFDSTRRQEPILDDQLKVEDNLEEFQEISEEDLEFYRKEVEELKESKYYIVGNFGGTALGDIGVVPAPMLKEPKGIRDVAEWYMSTIIRQDLLHGIFEGQLEIAIKNLEKIYNVVGDSVGTAFICATDFGTQTEAFCSVDTFRNLYKPHYLKMNNWINENTNWKIFKHSCGSIDSLIEEMHSSGFEAINPVQWTAEGMDPEKIKEKHGKNVVFWGGGVDTQKTLPFGTPEEVRDEVLRVCKIFSKDGGFIFNTVHNIQAETPTENLVAMIDALHEYNSSLK